MVELKFKIVEQKIQKVNNPFLVNKSRNYLRLSFSFNKTWKDLKKYIIFDNEYEFILERTDKKYTILVPSILLLDESFSFSIYGVNDEDVLITTENVIVNLEESGYTTSIRTLVGDLDKEVFTDIYQKLDFKFDDVTLEDGYLICYANQVELDRVRLVDFLEEYYTKDEIDLILGDKADVIHTHSSDDISDLSETISSDVKASYRQLANRIRTSSP